MGNIDKMTVISADGAGELTKQVTNNLVQTMEMLKATTGLDVESLIQKYSTTNGRPRPPSPEVRPTARPPPPDAVVGGVPATFRSPRMSLVHRPSACRARLAGRAVSQPRASVARCGSRTAREGAYADPSPLGRT